MTTTLTAHIEALNAALASVGATPLTTEQTNCLSDDDRMGEALDMLDDLRARVLCTPRPAVDALAHAVNARRPFWITCADDLPLYFLTYTDAAEALASNLRSLGAIHDRDGESHVTIALNAAAAAVEDSSNKIDDRAAGVHYTLDALEPVDRSAAIDRLAAVFCRTLRETIGNEATDEAARLNAEDNDPQVCRSHDHCDANEVMAAAWVEVWQREAMTCDEDDANAWNAAWAKAKASGFKLTA